MEQSKMLAFLALIIEQKLGDGTPCLYLSLTKFEFHYTPEHGSWLNIAETELSSLSMQCLGNRRVPKIQELNEMLAEWERNRNLHQRELDDNLPQKRQG